MVPPIYSVCCAGGGVVVGPVVGGVVAGVVVGVGAGQAANRGVASSRISREAIITHLILDISPPF
jgi:hypothetical protein